MRDNYQRLVQPRLDEIRAWTAKCLTQAEIIAALGVGNDAYGRYKKKYADLRDAVSRGRAIADDAVVSAAYRRAVGYTVTEIREETGTTARGPVTRHIETQRHIPGDPGAQKFWLLNRQPLQWQDHHDVLVSGDVSVSVMPQGTRPTLPSAPSTTPTALPASPKQLPVAVPDAGVLIASVATQADANKP